ncbi:MAG: NAD(P)-binding domain-containing protein [Spirochaetia bacterium]|nr:NAD(P)-binding domain-containing protein [Spirochaetia bacterium]
MPKIFVSTYPYSRTAKEPIDLLRSTGWEIQINPLGRKLKSLEVAELAHEFDGIIAGTEDLRPLIESSEKLKIISRVGIGLDSVPLGLCKEKSIVVTYTPDAVSMAVVELTIGLMVSLTRQVVLADRQIRDGSWTRPYGKRIEESIIGIIGFGRIGSKVAKLLTVFKPRQVLVYDIKNKEPEITELKKSGLNIDFSSLNEIYTRSDIVTLHVPYSKLSRYMIDLKVFEKMKPDAYLINTARGGIVREDHLYDAIKLKKIAGAAMDVFEEEPYHGQLIELENVILLQHMGSCSYDCRLNMEFQAAEDMVNYFKGKPLINQVPEEEYAYQE